MPEVQESLLEPPAEVRSEVLEFLALDFLTHTMVESWGRERSDGMTTTTTKKPRPKCANCGSGNIYVLRDGSVICRACGHKAESKQQK